MRDSRSVKHDHGSTVLYKAPLRVSLLHMERYFSKKSAEEPSPLQPAAKRKKPTAASKQGDVSASTRAAQYLNGTFYAENDHMYCRTCNMVVEHVRKTTVDRHLTSKTHKLKVDNSKASEENQRLRMQSMATVVQHSTAAALTRKELDTDLCRTFLTCNIPLEKVDHPALRDFLERRVQGAGAIPSAEQLRQTYIPIVQQQHDEDLQNILDESDAVILTVDESGDNTTDRDILNIIITPVSADKPEEALVSYIADQIFLDECNHKTVSKHVMQTVDKYHIHASSVIAFITDNVAYMTKAYEVLKIFYENCVHISCTTHLLDLLADRLPKYNDDVHKLMLKWKSYFKNSSKRCRRFSSFIASKGLKTTKCPKPCRTRWTPWLNAVYWHSERIQYYNEFLDKEPCTSDSTVRDELHAMITPEIERSFFYIGSVTPTLVDWIVSLQTNSRVGHHLIDTIADIRSFLVVQRDNDSYSEWEDMWIEILAKFDVYFGWTGPVAPTYCQKGLQFFKLTRLLDPVQAKMLKPAVEDLLRLPLFGKVPREQIQSYLGEVALISPTSTTGYWAARTDRWKELSRAAVLTLSIPCHSCEVERSFSAYSRIMTDLRTNMKDSTVRTCNMLHFNSII